MKIKARMYAGEIAAYGSPDHDGNRRAHENVKLSAVYSSDKNSPNYSYSEATPHAELVMTITNKGAIGFFKPGAVYDLTFQEVKTGAPK